MAEAETASISWDFFCPSAKLVIEVDGEIHQYTQEEDAVRQAFLESMGLCVVRFSNHEVINQLPAVLRAISDALSQSGQSMNERPDELPETGE